MIYRQFLSSLWSKESVDSAALLQEAISLGSEMKTAHIKTNGIEAALNSDDGSSAIKMFHNFYRVDREVRRVDELVDFKRLVKFLKKIGIGDPRQLSLLRNLAAIATSGEGIAVALSFSDTKKTFEKASIYLWPRPGKDLDLVLSRLPAFTANIARGLLERGGLFGLDLHPRSVAGTTVKVYVNEGEGPPGIAVDEAYARIGIRLKALGFPQYKLKYVFPMDAGLPSVEASYAVPLTTLPEIDLNRIADVGELISFRSFIKETAPRLDGAYICSIGIKPDSRSLQIYFVFPQWVDMKMIL